MNLPAPGVVPLIESKSEYIRRRLGLAGESVDRLFASVYFLRPVADFRDEVRAALPSVEAGELIELCETRSSPRVSFETAPTTSLGGRN